MPPARGRAGGVLTSDFELYLGCAQVRVRGDGDAVKAGLRASLGSCDRPLVAPTRQVELVVDATQATLDGEQVSDAGAPECALPLVEKALYERLPAWHPRAWLLHAAALVVRGKPVLIAGESGQGKSTLARDILERGQRYLTDELCFYDGERLWGLPRAIQFDPVPTPGAKAEGVLRGCDLQSYRFWGLKAEPLTLPLWPVPPELRAEGALAPGGTKIVFVRRASSTSMHPLDPAHALTRLHAAVVGQPAEPAVALSTLLEQASAWQLDWDRGHRAWGHLRALLGL